MGVLKWLQVGIALFLAFETPEVRLSPNAVKVSLELKNILTEEMKPLLTHGVDFEYELYCSLSAAPLDSSRDDNLSIARIVRRMSYDFLGEKYLLYEDGRLTYASPDMDGLIREGKRFSDVTFTLPTEQFGKYSLFAQVRLLDNKTLRDGLNMGIDELWVGYKPSIRYEFVDGMTP